MKCIKQFAVFCALPLLIVPLIMTSCQASLTVKANDLTKDIVPSNAAGKAPDENFVDAMADFSVKLFQKSSSDQKNSMISPLSAMLALSMTANGANGNTTAEFQQILGSSIAQDVRNQYLLGFTQSLKETENTKFHLANSIWIRKETDRDVEIKRDFLQLNADYYGASVYDAPFDEQTVKDVNSWVSYHTNKMIPEMITDPTSLEASVMLLINAMSFDAQWQRIYAKESIRSSVFTSADGKQQDAEMMHSMEWGYLEDGKATGFLKKYEGQYSFAALLPNEGTSVEEYVASLTGEGLIDTLQNPQSVEVSAALPKFSYDFSFSLKESLQAMGMQDAFKIESADFSKMSDEPLYISDAIQKTHITVDEKGTKAGAATMISMNAGGAPSEPKTVILDRPFVYAIIDNETSLPLFLGTVMEVTE